MAAERRLSRFASTVIAEINITGVRARRSLYGRNNLSRAGYTLNLPFRVHILRFASDDKNRNVRRFSRDRRTAFHGTKH